MGLVELKSQAYDCMANIEALQMRLRQINEMIQRGTQELIEKQNAEVKPEEVKGE